ncbi:MAG: hypothetical protein ACN6O6_18970 [Pseudomonas sp.]|uniref:hypothetical protein n=1 Tax=Pseudomonas sp. TaxID=306 RepID=UPI003D13C458
MRVFLCLAVSLLMLAGTQANAQNYQPSTPRQPAAGSPGTATPQPYSQPVPRNVPKAAPGSAPLLNPGTGSDTNNGTRSYTPRDNRTPRDSDLPLLQEQRERNNQGLGDERREAQ